MTAWILLIFLTSDLSLFSRKSVFLNLALKLNVSQHINKKIKQIRITGVTWFPVLIIYFSKRKLWELNWIHSVRCQELISEFIFSQLEIALCLPYANMARKPRVLYRNIFWIISRGMTYSTDTTQLCFENCVYLTANQHLLGTIFSILLLSATVHNFKVKNKNV